jgi:hypothetical protein
MQHPEANRICFLRPELHRRAPAILQRALRPANFGAIVMAVPVVAIQWHGRNLGRGL